MRSWERTSTVPRHRFVEAWKVGMAGDLVWPVKMAKWAVGTLEGRELLNAVGWRHDVCPYETKTLISLQPLTDRA